MANLRTADPGDHVMTVTVAPENLGPVTVRAHIGADGMRIELLAPTEAGREALKGIMTELRRDLAGLGLAPSSLSAGGGQTAGGGTTMQGGEQQAGGQLADRPERSERHHAGDRMPAGAAQAPAPSIRHQTTGIDILA